MNIVLKPLEELQERLAGRSRVGIVACKLCFKELTEDRSQDLSALKSMLLGAGLECVRTDEVDFLCNGAATRKMVSLWDPIQVDAWVTCCCGVGTQVVSSLVNKPVIPAADTMDGSRYEGFTAGESKRCRACGQCVLNWTAGICPIAYCAKELLNGPCGGAKQGQCEVDRNKPCAWIQIHERLRKQGRTGILGYEPKVRNHNRPSFTESIQLARSTQARRDQSFQGGVYPLDEKEPCNGLSIQSLPAPSILILPMSQHVGPPCRPLVKPGDAVTMGQRIGEPVAMVSAPIHAPVSGKIVAVEPRPHPILETPVLSVVIENDGLDTLCPGIGCPVDVEGLSPERIVELVQDRGLVGLGGAMFPTHVKLKRSRPVDALLLNGCECEPYLSADHRLMIERPSEILSGAGIMAKALGISRIVVVVEDNKPDAFESLAKAAGPNVEVLSVPTKYPQGGERMLVKKVLDRVVPRGGLPLDVGALVSNVGTACAVHEAIVKGLPLMERVVTIAGPGVERPGNFKVRIGTPVVDALRSRVSGEVSGILSRFLVKMGGPMMGWPLRSLDVPIIKGTSGLTVLCLAEIPRDETRKCIKCGRCVDVCPMELKPHLIGFYELNQDAEKLASLSALDCIECGCCEYICSAKLPLQDQMRQAKRRVRRT